LVDNLTHEQQILTNQILGELPLTDNKYRLLVLLDPNAKPYLIYGVFPIYHIALENINIKDNYGIFANGLLVESCSIDYIKNMTML